MKTLDEQADWRRFLATEPDAADVLEYLLARGRDEDWLGVHVIGGHVRWVRRSIEGDADTREAWERATLLRLLDKHGLPEEEV